MVINIFPTARNHKMTSNRFIPRLFYIYIFTALLLVICKTEIVKQMGGLIDFLKKKLIKNDYTGARSAEH